MRSMIGIVRVFVVLAGMWPMLSWSASVSDALGRKVTVGHVPQRIVALAPSLTEILYFLGLGGRVVGVTRFSSYPPQASEKPRVGSYVDINVEKIVSLSPDLVIGTADGNRPAVVALLERAGIPVFVVNPRTIREVIATVVTVGKLCGVAQKALRLAAALSARVDRIVAKTVALRRPVVFLQVNLKPIMTVNANTFSSDLVRLAGGANMAADEPMSYPRIGREAVIRGRPEVIVISSMERGGAFAEMQRQWLAMTIVPAAKTGRIYLVDSDLVDRPAPRIVDGLEILARYIHPEVQWDE